MGWMFVHNTSENNPGMYLVTYNNIKPTQPRYKYNDLTRSKYIKSNGHRFKNFKTYKLTSLKDTTTTFGLTPFGLCYRANLASSIPDFIIHEKNQNIFFLRLKLMIVMVVHILLIVVQKLILRENRLQR